MKDKELRYSLISSQKAKQYIKDRKKYFKEEVTNSTTLKNGHIVGIEIDKQTKQIVGINNWSKPARPDYFGLTEEELKVCERIRESVKRQVKRIKAHISFLLSQPDYVVLFLTLTFTNEVLETTSAETRKQTIRRFLTRICEDYIANVDYGTETEREHYHAIIAIPYARKEELEKHYDKKIGINYNWQPLEEGYKYGNYTLQMVRVSKTSVRRLGAYIDKLALHAFKVDQKSIMTPRGTRYQAYKNSITPNESDTIANTEQAEIIANLTEEERENLTPLFDLFKGNVDIEIE